MALGQNNPQVASLINIFQGVGVAAGKGYQISVVLSAVTPSVTQGINLLSLGMYGARSVVIDNLNNPSSVLVAFSNTTQRVSVQAYTTMIVPFFGPTGPFNVTFTGDGVNAYTVNLMFSDAYLPPAQWQSTSATPTTAPVSDHLSGIGPVALYPSWTAANVAQATRTKLNVSCVSYSSSDGVIKMYISLDGVNIFQTLFEGQNYAFGVGLNPNYLGAIYLSTNVVLGSSANIIDTY